MKAIVTGGAGFIGCHLARRLLQEGWYVLVADNLSSGYLQNVPEGADFLWLDLTQEDSIDQLPGEGVDIVFHLASHVGQELSFQRPLYDFKANAFSTLLLLKWCLEHKIKQFVLASSVNVYGNHPELPYRETTPVSPPSPYAVGKLASEHLCSIYNGFGVHTTALRLFNVYGPLQDMHNLLQGMVSIYMAYVARREPLLLRGAKERFRDFSYVEDVADAFYRCINEKAYGKVYNIASGRKTYVQELIEMIIGAFDFDPATYPIIQGMPTTNDQFGFYGDASLIEKELGWKPSVALEEGIKRMALWVKESGIIRNKN